MNFIYGIILALGIGIVAAQGSDKRPAELKCGPEKADVPNAWRDMAKPLKCAKIMKEQVQHEIDAAITYMAMGAHFARDSINRLGFSELFFKSASEEREHAIKIIEYLLMRGELTEDVSGLLKTPVLPAEQSWSNGVKALQHALELEAGVTLNIKDIIKECEKPDNLKYNNYHLVDYLTGVFLDEQYNGQREIAGRISTLGKMHSTYGDLGEFLYDKKLLNGEL